MATPYVQVITQGVFPLVHQITDTVNANTTSSTDATLTSMTYTPAAGTYLVLFNTDINSTAAGAAVTFSYYLAAVQVAASQRKIIPFDGGTLSAGAARGMACLQHVITVTGSQVVDVRWSVSSGTATSANRALVFMQVTSS